MLSDITRRACLSAMTVSALTGSEPDAAPSGRPIQLHCDLSVDPHREQDMVDNFEKSFRPVSRKQPGFIDLKMLKLKDAIRGAAEAPVPVGDGQRRTASEVDQYRSAPPKPGRPSRTLSPTKTSASSGTTSTDPSEHFV